jgi:hypothetical protein
MTTDLRARVAYSVAKTRHRLRKRRDRGVPNVVFSIAKSGSSAIAAAMRDVGVGPVFQVHDLDPDFLAAEEDDYRWSGRPWRNWDAQCLLSRLPTTDARWHVVSLVRDPIAQRASAFFQPGERLGYLNADSTVDSLMARFGDDLEQLPLDWFESHVEAHLGIDVYASEFDTEKGYDIIKTPTASLLLLRCEGLDAAPRALAELFELDRLVPVHHVNVGSEKPYGELYSAFVSALKPSREVLDRAYSSRMVRHFYSPDEIARFRDVWSVRGVAGEPQS